MQDRPRAVLRCDALEDRLTPALSIQFDYRFDSEGFFADAGRRAMLQQAADDLTSRIASTPAAIAPSGSNTWNALVFNPATGSQTSVSNLSIPQGTIVVFAGARDLVGSQAAVGGSGGYSLGGNAAWQNLIAYRGLPSYTLWGGSITFDTSRTWFTGSNPAGPSSCVATV